MLGKFEKITFQLIKLCNFFSFTFLKITLKVRF